MNKMKHPEKCMKLWNFPGDDKEWTFYCFKLTFRSSVSTIK